MPYVLGRGERATAEQAGRLGSYRARDGSRGAPLYLDLDRPHAALVVGKRGYGKSYTLGVLAESLARTGGVAPVIVDPMGAFRTLAAGDDCGVDEERGSGDRGNGERFDGETACGKRADREQIDGKRADGRGIDSDDATAGEDGPVRATVIEQPRVDPAALDPRSWCALLGLSPESGAGSLVWRAARSASTIAEAQACVEAATEAPQAERRAATNHLQLAADWDVFDPGGLTAASLASPEVTVLDVSGLDRAPRNAVVRGVGEALYRARVEESIARLPWLLVDEAHVCFDSVAEPALETILTRGRAPGVSLVLATQRPAVVPEVAVSQSDLLLAHRLTSERDLEALGAAQATYVDGTLRDRLPAEPGEALVIDDATESVHAVRIRERDTPHGGDSARASELRSETT